MAARRSSERRDWQAAPLGERESAELRAKLARLPDPVPDALLALWGRGGVAPAVLRTGVLGFGLRDVLS